MTDCKVYWPASILAWGSELRFSRRMTIFAFCLGSVSSASDCEASEFQQLSARRL